jgi:hypothetical protein
VLDFATAEWHYFETQQQAVAQMLQPDDRVRMRHHLPFGPVASKRGSKGFLSWQGGVHVQEQGKWSTTSISAIAGPQARVTGMPHYDGKGRFHIPLDHRHYYQEANGKWTTHSNANTSYDRTYPASQDKPSAAEAIANVTSTCYDRFGVAWLTTAEGHLWKCLDQQCLQILDGTRLQVLKPSTRLSRVLVDAKGNAFLQHEGHQAPIEYEQLPAKPATALPPAKVTQLKAGSTTLEAALPAQGWVRLRVNRGKWSPLSQRSSLALDTLQPGQHTVSVQRFDAELTPQGETQSLAFEIKPIEANVLSDCIQQLKLPALEAREAAVKTLKAQGNSALPALKQALDSAKDAPEWSWWIRAVIQQIEHAKP